MSDEPNPPRLLTVAMLIEGDDGLYEQDAIEYQGKIWLVPEWLDSPVLGYRIPARIISLETLRHQPMQGWSAEFVINDPLPIDVIEGRAQSPLIDKYVVIEEPDLRFPLPSNRMN
jgi:hypothetical protein